MFLVKVKGMYLTRDGDLSKYISHAIVCEEIEQAEHLKAILVKDISENDIYIEQRKLNSSGRTRAKRRTRRTDGIDIWPTDDENF